MNYINKASDLVWHWPERASYTTPWWIKSDQEMITPFDYSSHRIDSVKEFIIDNKITIDKLFYKIKKYSSDDFSYILILSKLVQDNILHNPVFQPSESVNFFENISSLKDLYGFAFRKRELPKNRLINDVMTLLLLGEGRCGQVAKVLADLFLTVGFNADIEQLNNHIVTKITLGNKEYLIDADAFKNGIFFLKENNSLYTRKEILDNPIIVDRFKHTGWMFRRNTRYYRNSNNHNFTGYIDFYAPEEDGAISGKYGNSSPHFPPGVPVLKNVGTSISLKLEEKYLLAFNVEYSERVSYYIVRVCTKSKKYRYDNLIYDNLLNETKKIEYEYIIKEKEQVISISTPGIYYVTACSISEYLHDLNNYVWWSDELQIVVS